jgi:hypothetical protein
MVRGGSGEVLYFLKEPWGFAGWHFFCGLWWRWWEPRDSWVCGMIDINEPLLIISRDHARHHFLQRVSAL